MKLMRWLGLAAVALIVGGAAQAQTVKIGVVLPFSGANADLGHQIDKAFDLYVKLHAKDIAPYKVEIVKRDEGPPTGAVAKTVDHRTHHQRQGAAGHRLRVLAVGDRAGAGRDPGQGADGDRQCRHRLDHQPVALHRAAVVQHVAPGLSDGRLCSRQGRLQDRGHGLYRLPARQGFDRSLQDRFREGRRQDRRLDPDGLAGAGAGLHAVLPEDQGRASRLHVRLHSLRARTRPA